MIGNMIRIEGFVPRYEMFMKTSNPIIARGCLEVVGSTYHGYEYGICDKRLHSKVAKGVYMGDRTFSLHR